MGFTNPDVPWSELERRLSDRPPSTDRPGDGSDAPAWSRHRPAYEPPDHLGAAGSSRVRRRSGYAELHCHSAFSFLDGASLPETLVEEATRLAAMPRPDKRQMELAVGEADAAKKKGGG